MGLNNLLPYLTMAVLFFQAFISYKQSLLSKKQKDLLAASLDLQSSQRDIAQNEFVSTHRPKIIIRNVHFEDTFKADASFNVEFRYINIGEVKADIELIEADVFASRRDDVGFEKRPLVKCEYDKISLMPGESGIGSIKRVNHQNPTGSMADEDRIFCVGCVQYRDDAGIHRQTGFARVYDGDTKRFCQSDDEEYEYSY